MGELQERITSTKKGSVTSVQAVYVPADDITDPAPATTFAHLDATMLLVASAVGARHLSGCGPADLDLAHPFRAHRRAGALRRGAGREAHSAALQGPAGHHRDSRYRRAVGRRQAHRVARARKVQRFLSQPFHVAEIFTGIPGAYVKVEDTVRSFKEIIDGKHDAMPGAGFLSQGRHRGRDRGGREDEERRTKRQGAGSSESWDVGPLCELPEYRMAETKRTMRDCLRCGW